MTRNVFTKQEVGLTAEQQLKYLSVAKISIP
jgi:hypothetical protein